MNLEEGPKSAGWPDVLAFPLLFPPHVQSPPGICAGTVPGAQGRRVASFSSRRCSLSRSEQKADSDGRLMGLFVDCRGAVSLVFFFGLSQVIFFKPVFEKPKNQVWLVSRDSRRGGYG